jgi:hypothetical protein
LNEEPTTGETVMAPRHNQSRPLLSRLSR